MKVIANNSDQSQLKITRRSFVTRSLKSIALLAVLKPKKLFDTSISFLGLEEKVHAKNPIIGQKDEVKPQKSLFIHSHQLINFYNTHTGEWLKKCRLPIKEKMEEGLKEELDYIFRDFRTKEVYPIDPKLYQLLASLLMRINTHKPVHIVSGYRSLKSNNFLRQCSNGVARKSYHTKGKALDFFIEGITHKRIARTALDMKKGGVGRYRSFIHIDTGPFRTWT